MESIARYRELIQRVITRHAQIPSVSGEVRIETIFDAAQDHYALVYTGWDGLRRIEGEVSTAPSRKGLGTVGWKTGGNDLDPESLLGPQTRMVLQQYQAKLGLPKNGELDEAARKALGVY